MGFEKIQYWPFISAGLIFLLIVFIMNKRRFSRWISDHWFFSETKTRKVSFIFYLLGFAFLALSLLDLRGVEEKIETKIPDQRTVVLIDTSASMLVEDIRPSRFSRALLIARHFVKKAAGHQVSVLLFSDTQKKLVPFTDDPDLLDARISGLEGLNLRNGGSNLSLAMQEAIQYLKASSSNRLIGNLLVITDGEENGDKIKKEIPQGISVGVVGVGTKRGGPIPLRNKYGSFNRYKKFKGETVISKLDEGFIQKLGDSIKEYRYWIVRSYNIPTEEILNFFSQNHSQAFSYGDIRIKPVLSHLMLLPAFMFFFLALVMKFFKMFKPIVVLLLCLGSLSMQAQEKKTIPIEDLDKIRSGRLSKKEKLKMAENWLRQGFDQEAQTLYEENIDKNKADPETLFNLGTAYLKNGSFDKGLEIYKGLKEHKALSDEQKEIVRENTLLALRKKKTKKNQKGKSNKGKGQGKEKNSQNDQKGDDPSDKNKKEDQSQGSSDQEKNKNSKDNKNKPKDQKDQNDQKNNDQKDKQGSDQKNQKKNDAKPEQGKKEKGNKKKVSGLLKQLMDQDRQLQNKVLDTKTSESKKSDKKDW